MDFKKRNPTVIKHYRALCWPSAKNKGQKIKASLFFTESIVYVNTHFVLDPLCPLSTHASRSNQPYQQQIYMDLHTNERWLTTDLVGSRLDANLSWQVLPWYWPTILYFCCTEEGTATVVVHKPHWSSRDNWASICQCYTWEHVRELWSKTQPPELLSMSHIQMFTLRCGHSAVWC